MTLTLKKPIIFACIPALNEQLSIAPVIMQTSKFVDKVFVCDDGSKDLTAEIVLSLGANLIRHQRNMGKGAALRSLFKAIDPYDPDIVIVLDSDGQHDPKEIPKIIEPILNGEADLVIGSRFMNGSRMNAPLYRRIGLRFINMLNKSGVKDTQSGLRAFSKKALQVVMKNESDGYGVETEQISLAKKFGLKIVEVPAEVKYGGSLITSKKNPLSQGLEILITIIRLVAEERPLLTLGVLGCISLCVSVVSCYYLLYFYNSIRYFSMPWALLFFFSFTLGILLSASALFLHSIQRLIKKINENIDAIHNREEDTITKSE